MSFRPSGRPLSLIHDAYIWRLYFSPARPCMTRFPLALLRSEWNTRQSSFTPIILLHLSLILSF